MRLRLTDVVPVAEQQRFAEHWKTIKGASLVRDAAILIERKAAVVVADMATNGNKRMSLDLVVIEGAKWDEFINWLDAQIPPMSQAAGELHIRAHELGNGNKP